VRREGLRQVQKPDPAGKGAGRYPGGVVPWHADGPHPGGGRTAPEGLRPNRPGADWDVPWIRLWFPRLRIESGNKLRYANRWRVQQYRRRIYGTVGRWLAASGWRRPEDPPADRRCLVIRSHRARRIRDIANLIEGCKFLIDALTWRHPQGWGFIRDDSDEWVEIHYEQVLEPGGPDSQGTEVEVWRRSGCGQSG